jgi:hypothetical protein
MCCHKYVLPYGKKLRALCMESERFWERMARREGGPRFVARGFKWRARKGSCLMIVAVGAMAGPGRNMPHCHVWRWRAPFTQGHPAVSPVPTYTMPGQFNATACIEFIPTSCSRCCSVSSGWSRKHLPVFFLPCLPSHGVELKTRRAMGFLDCRSEAAVNPGRAVSKLNGDYGGGAHTSDDENCSVVR